MSTAESLRKRPVLFRALGRHEPPAEIVVDRQPYRRTEILKHDSWAATALYQGPVGVIVCKFNRIEPVFGVPMAWLGCWLAARERSALEQLVDVPGVPPACGKVYAGGRWLPNAVAHPYIEGHPLARHESVPAGFFPALQTTLAEMHRRGIAYVDLHKRENIIVGADGRPYLIDFQIHCRDHGDPFSRAVFQLLCRADDYHLGKHKAHHHGQSLPARERHLPWWIRVHRFIARPLRQARRRLLALIGIRGRKGRADTEQFPEDAVRRELRRAA